jgi:hypothetical protein
MEGSGERRRAMLVLLRTYQPRAAAPTANRRFD